MSLPTWPAEWQSWIAPLQATLHQRSASRLGRLLWGVVLAKGRRTVTAWLRAAGIARGWQSYYHFLASLGPVTELLAGLVLRRLVTTLAAEGPLVFALDDTPTKRYGSQVQGAGVHHNPTPGPAGAAFLYGHVWVTLAWLVTHPCWGVLGLPVRALLYLRRGDVGRLPRRLGWRFQTKLEQAGQLVAFTARWLQFLGRPLWFVTDGAYAKRPFLRAARQERAVVISRLRRDAALRTVPAVRPAGRRRPGRPRTYGAGRISLAKRAGQKRGWQALSCQQYGQAVVKRIKTFEATWRPAGGRIRVVLVDEPHGWRAYFSTDPALSARAILEQVAARSAIEQNFHDLKEVEGVGKQQVRRVWANVAAYHLSLWAHSLTELWAWDRPKEVLVDRRASPWDEAARRPSHADRRKALQRECLAAGFSRLTRRQPAAREIHDFVQRLIAQAA